MLLPPTLNLNLSVECVKLQLGAQELRFMSHQQISAWSSFSMVMYFMVIHMKCITTEKKKEFLFKSIIFCLLKITFPS